MEQGSQESLEKGQALLQSQQNLSLGDRDRLYGYLEGGGKIILPEPQVMLTEESVIPGLSGNKMSKAHGNTISLREDRDSVAKKIKTMTTDPARVRRNDPGDPDRCPVFSLHNIYSDAATKDWATAGCRSAGIGCIDCKKPLIDAILVEQEPMHERAAL